MTTTGELREIIAYQKREMIDDGYGGTTGAWVDKFQAPAKIHYLRGGETVIAARLSGTKVSVWSRSAISRKRKR